MSPTFVVGKVPATPAIQVSTQGSLEKLLHANLAQEDGAQSLKAQALAKCASLGMRREVLAVQHALPAPLVNLQSLASPGRVQHVPVVTIRTATLKLPAFLAYLAQELTIPNQHIARPAVRESFQMCLLSMRVHASHVRLEHFRAETVQVHAYHVRQDLLLTSLQASHARFVGKASMLNLRGILTSATLVLVATIKVG